MTALSLRVGLSAALVSIATVAVARPPDLPVNIKDIFAPAMSATPGAAQVPNLEAQARQLLQIGERCLVDGDLLMARNCFTECRLVAPDGEAGRSATEYLQQVEDKAVDGHRRVEAKSLFLVGEHCRKHRDFEMAERCYAEAVAFCENSPYGEMAAERLKELSRARKNDLGNGEESSEPPLPSTGAEKGPEDNAKWHYQRAQVAERFRDARGALWHYQKAHLTCPDCTVGQQALEAIDRIDQQEHGSDDTSDRLRIGIRGSVSLQ